MIESLIVIIPFTFVVVMIIRMAIMITNIKIVIPCCYSHYCYSYTNVVYIKQC